MKKQLINEAFRLQQLAGIQPIEYIHANNLSFCEGNVVKYVTRWREKGGEADLRKAIHYLELLIQLETKPSQPDGV